MIHITFIFPNTEFRVQKQYKSSEKVSLNQIYRIKENLLASSLPSQFDKNSIEYLRFFSMGKELEDGKTLKSYPLPDPSHPMPIHVHVICNNTPKINSTCCGFCRLF